MVRQYQYHYRDGPPISGDEECLYWIRYLTYHMAKANLSQVTHTHTHVHAHTHACMQVNTVQYFSLPLEESYLGNIVLCNHVTKLNN